MGDRSDREDWSCRPGCYEVRASCPNHPHQILRRDGRRGVCSACTTNVVLCAQTFGHKECVRALGHRGLHASRSGTSWPDGADSHP